MEKNKCGNRYAPEVRERAVRTLFEHQGEFDSQSAAIKLIAAKIGCGPDSFGLGFGVLRLTTVDVMA
jgi:transposase